MGEPWFGQRFCVIDDFLAAEDHHKVWRWFNGLSFAQVPPGQRSRRPADGIGYAAPDTVVPATKVAAATDLASLFGRMVINRAESLRSLVGDIGQDWHGVSVTPNYFPSGVRLSWHNDGAGRSGAYIYYAHPRWDAGWGGELLIVDESATPLVQAAADRGDKFSPDMAFDTAEEDAALAHLAAGAFVPPRPNRLVIFSADTYHAVARVDAAAGDHIRATLTGSFLTRPDS